MVKLDKKDYKLLYELSKNSRISITQLAKRTQMSREMTNYRMLRLVRKKVITDFIANIDETKLGFRRHVLYFAFQKVNEQDENEIIQYMAKHPLVSWMTTCTGKWNLNLDFIAKNLEQVQDFIKQVKEAYPGKISEYLVTSQMYTEHFHSKYFTCHLGNEKEQKIIPVKKQKLSEHIPDGKDLQILQLLAHDARMDYVTLGKKISLSPNAVKNRVQVLLDAGIIDSFSIYVDKQKFGYQLYCVHLDFVNQTPEDEQKLIAYIRDHPTMISHYWPLGPWNMGIDFFVRNTGELRRLILDLRNVFGDFIKIHDTEMYYEEPKANFLPEGVFV